MLRKFFQFIILFVFSIAIFGCGPEDSIRDEKEAQELENFEKSKSRFQPAIGFYKGTLTTWNLEAKAVHLDANFIIKHVTLLGDSNAGITRTASLGGVVYRDLGGLDDLYFPDFSKGDFDLSTGAINLIGAGVEFVGVLNGDELVGELSTVRRKGMRFRGVRQPTR